jgi:N-methylhydantoinase A
MSKQGSRDTAKPGSGVEYVVGIDIGGTCTDCTVVDQEGVLTLGKAFTTYPTFADGIVDALANAAEQLGLDGVEPLLRDTRLFLHSTTVAENALVNDDLAPAGLITTRGHEDTLYATRGGFGRWSGLTEEEKRNPIDTDKPPALLPRKMVLGVRERVDARGTVLAELDEEGVRTAVGKIVAAGAEAVGVSFLWSFANSGNELAARALIEREWPDIFVSTGHELSPMIGEYERTSTVALNVRLGPVVGRYLDELRVRLESLGLEGQVLVMQAYGGLLPIEKAADKPVGMIESGPVAGLVGSKFQGALIGLDNIIAADMGGTTFKVGVVREGLIEYQWEPTVLRYHYALPKMDVTSLGVAGGSIISVDPRTGIPQVGPQSAGSYPGPVCYNHGGTEPTITDVDAILGYLNPDFFLGGRAGIDVDKAREALQAKVAEPLGMTVMEAAGAVYRLANSMIYDLLHRATVQRGLDPRRFSLFSMGGTAGMHVAAYGLELGVDPIVVPYSASVQGAFGLVSSDVVHEEQISHPVRLPADPAELNDLFAGLRSRVVEQLKEEGFEDDQIRVRYSADMSYRRQTHILTVPLPIPDTDGSDGASALLTEELIEKTADAFEELYREKYGQESGYREAGIEMVSFRVRGSGLVRRPELKPEELGAPDPSAAVVETRTAWVDEWGRMDDVKGYDFRLLQPGNEIPGPAIVWTPITTVVVSASHTAAVDGFKNLVLTVNDGA